MYHQHQLQLGPKKTTNTQKTQNNKPIENGTKKEQHTFVKPQLKPVPPKEPTKLQSKEVKVPIKLNSVADRPINPPIEPKRRGSSKDESDAIIDKAMPVKRNDLVRADSLKKMTPKAPPMPPPVPKAPRPPDAPPLTEKKQHVLEHLRSRPKQRPDWTGLLKDIESGRKLKHVVCNDRSKPLLPNAKAKEGTKEGHFVYETEKQTAHNDLLKEIQKGVSLKKVKTNDRSKPILEGLRKFRRQMTIEEQIQKSQSMASIPPEEIEPDEVDELDDIDKVRDDLQSTKQLLAIELRNKEALARENKKLQTKILQLEAELEKERNKKQTQAPSTVADEKLMKTLKSEAEEARKTAEELEKKFHTAANQLDNTRSELEELRRQKMMLEKKLQDGKRMSVCERKPSVKEESSEEEEESESEDDGEMTPEKVEKKAQKEVKQLKNKLLKFKNKEDNAKKERVALKTQMKTLQAAMRDEKKKYKGLKKEVDKMAALMKETSEDEDEEEPEEEEETETETETESESESSGSESESELSVSEAEDAPVEKKKQNLSTRTNKHENRLAALKKGNYMLKTNVERLQDDMNKQKDMTMELQQELDSVLADLG
ncbi:DNA ligase 1 isoform X2 [Agrilus planipennis]|uniref:DNA ligase 1 isoform X2 n=1 Tax=Agrilus planipennis TaxID=224129 RepID=A0A1W4XWM6_AGRPL|nr:DNA ligase 1 isoform X2 [Agrilus planipennis]